MEGTSVTVVLIGAETADREYVQYEIARSWEIDNGLIGVYIHKLKDSYGDRDSKGNDPFTPSYTGIKTYDWVNDDGYNNLGQWIESAYNRAQQRQKMSA